MYSVKIHFSSTRLYAVFGRNFWLPKSMKHSIAGESTENKRKKAARSYHARVTTVKTGKSRSSSENIYLILKLEAKQCDWQSNMMYTYL